MSIKAMTWAFGLPLEGRAKIILLAIADNARDDGVAWPSRDMIAEKSSQSRATVNRRMKSMSDLGVMTLHERFRADGSQTTDEIRLDLTLTPEEVMRRMQASEAFDRGKIAEDPDAGGELDDTLDGEEGGYQPDTPPMQSGHPGDAVVTGGGLHSGYPLNEPSLEPESPPYPPLGGVRALEQDEAKRSPSANSAKQNPADGPLKKPDKAAIEKRAALWQRFLGSYPGIAAMDQQAARDEFEHLAVDAAEWAVSACTPYATECGKLRKPPKNAHIWLRKEMFKNFPPAGAPKPGPDSYATDSPEGRAIVMLFEVSGAMLFTSGRMVRYPAELTPQLMAFAQAPPRSHWLFIEEAGQIAAWKQFAANHVQTSRRDIVTTRGIGAERKTGIYAPWPWPPKKDGTIYRNDEPPAPPEENPDA